MSNEGINFSFAGQKLVGHPKDTVATALLRNGIRIFDRSMKQRRKRGASCMQGFCMSCLLEVNGEPDVLTCRTKLQEGMNVKPQVAWPKPTFDFLAPFQSKAFNLFGPELYYRLFTRPVWLNEIWINFLSSMTGRARIDINAKPRAPLPFNVKSTQVLIVGSGVAGIACAQEAHAAGLKVVLIDRNDSPGGWWSRWNALGEPPSQVQPINEKNLVIPEDVQFLSGTTVIGLYEDKSALAIGEDTAYRIHYEIVVIAAGCYPQLIAFPGSDEPLNLPVQGIVQAALQTGWTPSTAILLDLDENGNIWKNVLESLGIKTQIHTILTKKAILNNITALNGRSQGGIKIESGKAIRGEVVCWSAGWRPRLELIRQTGGVAAYQSREDVFAPVLQDDIRVSKDTYTAGGCANISGFEASYLHGKLVGATIAAERDPKQKNHNLEVISRQWLDMKNS